MKKNESKRSVKKPGKKANKLEEWLINSLAIVLLGGAVVFIIYMTTQMSESHSKETDQYLASLPSQNDTIAHQRICMVDDIYQGDYPTLPVLISNKTYYGCDVKASTDLKSKHELRTAIDPVTNRKVDKATAIIGLHAKRDGKVLYFESNETFNKYLSTLN